VESIGRGTARGAARKATTTKVNRSTSSVADLTWRNVALDHLWLGDETGLDVSAVPPRLAGAVATSVNWRAGFRPPGRDDAGHAPRRTLRWHDGRVDAHPSDRPHARPTRLLYEAWVAVAVRRRDRLTCGTRRTNTMPRHSSTPTVVTIHDLTFSRTPSGTSARGAVFSSFATRDPPTCSSPSVSSTLVNWTSRFRARARGRGDARVDLERFSADSSGDAELLRALGLAANDYIFSWDLEPVGIGRPTDRLRRDSRAVTTTWACWPEGPAGA